MAKISTYPADATPSLSDYLIGTDVNDANNTKTYTIGAILGAGNFPNTYVPYTGATANVDLGGNNLIFGNGNILFSGSNATISMPGGLSTIGVVGFLSATNINGNAYTVNNYVNFAFGSELRFGNNAGILGQVLISGGSGSYPFWSDIGALASRGQFFSTLNPTFVANTPTAIQLNNTDVTTLSGININLSTRITFAKTGKYKISYSCNLNVGASGNNHYMILFLRKNGTTDVPNSTRRYLTTSNSYVIRQGGESLVDVTAGDYFELMCAMTSTNLSLVYVPATLVAPIAPLEPSTLVTVIEV